MRNVTPEQKALIKALLEIRSQALKEVNFEEIGALLSKAITLSMAVTPHPYLNKAGYDRKKFYLDHVIDLVNTIPTYTSERILHLEVAARLFSLMTVFVFVPEDINEIQSELS